MISFAKNVSAPGRRVQHCGMGKLDDMRRQREAAYAKEHPDVPAPTGTGDDAPSAETGACSTCGKVRALRGGRVTSHQKGLGKMCSGSNQAPAAR